MSRKKASSEKIKELCDKSNCEILISEKDRKVEILISGELSSIPSIKNAKEIKYHNGRPYLINSKNTMDHLIAMDILFRRKLDSLNVSKLSFGDTKVFLLLLCAKRNRLFDPINTCETVQDWLEPSHKTSGSKLGNTRGWGVGVVNNDSQITSLAMHQSDVGGDESISRIIIYPLSCVSESLHVFLKSVL